MCDENTFWLNTAKEGWKSVQRTAVVIEDDRDIRGLIDAILTGAGFRVEVAETGASGVEAVRTHNPGIILVDFGLPDITGIEVIERIRGFSRMPILMLTGREDLAGRPYAAGADDVMTKPFNPLELRTRVSQLLENGEQAIAAGEVAG